MFTQLRGIALAMAGVLALVFGGRLVTGDVLADVPADVPQDGAAISGSAASTECVPPPAGSQPPDPRLGEQVELLALHAREAWFDVKPSQVTTAVIDTGVQLNHEDLVDRLVPGTSIGCSQNCNGSPNKDDVNRHHGTRVAGIIGATLGNAVGGAGVAGNTRMMSIYYGSAFSPLVAKPALSFAIDHHVDIVNGSWNIGESGDSWDEFLDEVRRAEREGILIVISSGNNGEDLDEKAPPPLRSGAPNVLVVMGVNDALGIGASNHGTTVVDIAAPDEASLTTRLHDERTDCYSESEGRGSSFAAAYVSGTAALLKSHYPDVSYDFLKWRILANATPDPALTDKNRTGGRLNLLGTLFPVTAATALRRSRAAVIQWPKGIDEAMCDEVAIDARGVTANVPGTYATLVAATDNDGEQKLDRTALAGITADHAQIRVRCVGKPPVAESVPLPLTN